MKQRYNKLAAQFYDLGKKTQDVKFYYNYAKKIEGEVLEVGCGTGRVATYLAQRGIPVTGLDNSQHTIDQSKIKCRKARCKNSLVFIKADAKNFKLNKKFKLIIMPFRVFQCFLTIKDQRAVLKNIKKHLAKDGKLIFDVYYPNPKILNDFSGKENVVGIFPHNKQKILKTYINNKIDQKKQITTTEIRYYRKGKTNNILLAKNTIKMKYFYKKEMQDLLKSEKFKIEKIYSDFVSKKFKPGKEMIFVCKKS
ncbi:class I SAM-dependent methyltransferase [Patescibacteria group bacterium]|nr:class I SAM-dependent methyltransferase [Patescibacteria group bacterium]